MILQNIRIQVLGLCRYGQDAGMVAQDATSAAVTGGLAYMRFEKVGLKKIARRVAKRTATGLMKAHVGGSSGELHQHMLPYSPAIDM